MERKSEVEDDSLSIRVGFVYASEYPYGCNLIALFRDPDGGIGDLDANVRLPQR